MTSIFDEVYQAARDSGAKLVFLVVHVDGVEGGWSPARCATASTSFSSTPNGFHVCRHGRNDHYGIPPPSTRRQPGQANLIFEDLNFDREVFHCKPCQLSDGPSHLAS